MGSLLQDESYSELITLRKYFLERKNSLIRTETDYSKPEVIVFQERIDDIDLIIVEKYKFDTNNFLGHNLIPEN